MSIYYDEDGDYLRNIYKNPGAKLWRSYCIMCYYI